MATERSNITIATTYKEVMYRRSIGIFNLTLAHCEAQGQGQGRGHANYGCEYPVNGGI